MNEELEKRIPQFAPVAAEIAKANKRYMGESVRQLFRRCATAAIRHERLTDEDTEFRAAMLATMMQVRPEEKDKIHYEMKILNAMSTIDKTNVIDPVLFEKPDPQKVYSLAMIWRQLKNKTTPQSL